MDPRYGRLHRRLLWPRQLPLVDCPQQGLAAEHTINIIDCTINTIDCTINTIDCTINTIDCTINTIDCTINTIDCIINTFDYTDNKIYYNTTDYNNNPIDDNNDVSIINCLMYYFIFGLSSKTLINSGYFWFDGKTLIVVKTLLISTVVADYIEIAKIQF